jgi:hypothetical protein
MLHADRHKRLGPTICDMRRDFHELHGDSKSIRILRGYLRWKGLFGECGSIARTHEPSPTAIIYSDHTGNILTNSHT